VSLLHAGPEVGVASTKAFTATVSSLMLFGVALAQEQQKLNRHELIKNIDEIFKIPSFIEKTLGIFENVKAIASQFVELKSVLFIGRGEQWPIAMEGALKLKEISYIHAEGYAAGELKHGPIALIDDNMHVVCLAPQDSYYEKTMSNIEEIRARGGKIFAIGTLGDHELEKISENFIGIDKCSDLILPFLTTTVLHLFAYSVALIKGCDVDQPRNLAKSVTVE
jgi:glucosamine--fructose-6-phosphate aminotransferase (isomerizing)